MKKNLSKIAVLGTALMVGVSLVSINSQSYAPVQADAHQTNFDDYSYSGSYYDALDTSLTDGLQGTFRKALTSLIFPDGWYTYGSSGSDHLSTVLQSADADPTNSSNMIYFYTRDSVKKNAASTWNREHVWPQSLSSGHWGTDEAGTDLLHIRPTYNDTNSKRGNLVYGDVNKQGQVIYSGVVYGYISGKYFEPIDSVKGDVARIIMYVWTTYYDYYKDSSLLITKTMQSYDTLLKWHTLDKPDVLEGNRNNYSQTSKQKNRNPFVDHPEYAWRIFGNSASESVKNACMEAYPAQGVTVKNVKSIAINGEAKKKEYIAGESFNPDGLTVTATYEDNTTATVPNTNCEWTPNKLTVGTTSVTCKYRDKTATYSGITVKERQQSETGDAFSVVFTKTADSGTEISNSNIGEYYEKNDLVDSVSNLVKVFPGANGLKLGSSKADGRITFNLKSIAQNHVIRVTVKTTAYSGGGSFVLKINDVTAASGVAGTDCVKELNKETVTSIGIEASGRMYINSVDVEIAKNGAPDTPVDSSEPPVSSSEETIVSSEEQITSNQPVISSQNNDSSSNTPVIPNEENKGCNGSIITSMSLISITTLVGLVFALSKKKH